MAVWDNYMNEYKTSQEYLNNQKWQNATIQDVANKYGFNFSQDYANQQAEVAAQAKRNEQQAAQRQNASANTNNIRSINDSLREGVIGTENSTFQQYLAQRQQQANKGINAGLQADQNLRLNMNAQSVLGGFYRDAARNKAAENERFTLENQKISEALAQVESEKNLQSTKLYQDMLAQGYGILGTERGYYNDLDSKVYGQTQDKLANYYREQELALQRARVAADRAAKDATTSSTPTGQAAELLAEFNDAKTAGANTLADKYLANTSARLNAGRSVARKPIEELDIVKRYLPNTINPRLDRSLSVWEKNKIDPLSAVPAKTKSKKKSKKKKKK